MLVNVISNIFKKTGLGQNLLREPIHTLEYLVSILARFATSEPRDTIYCFMNLAKETYSPNMTVSKRFQPPSDYTSELFKVYAGFIGWVYQDSGRIDILCRWWAHRGRLEDTINTPKPVRLPSWIQTIPPEDLEDKQIGLRLHRDSFVGSPDHIAYNASHNLPAEIRSAPGSLPTPLDSASGSPEKSLADLSATSVGDPRLADSLSNHASNVVDARTSENHVPYEISPITESFPLVDRLSSLGDSGISFEPQGEH